MKYIIGLTISFFTFVSFASAKIIITEIMYDPQTTEGEWLEVYNNGDSDVDLKNWKLFDGVNHTIPTFIVPAGSYAILADNKVSFLSVYPNVSVPVVDIVTSFNNDGDTVILRDLAGSDQSTVGYTASSGANKNGKTLQLLNGVFVAGDPSIGGPTTISESDITNTTASSTVNNTNTNATNTTNLVNPVITTSSSGNVSPFRVLSSDQQVYASAGGNRVVVAGALSIFTAKVVTSSSKVVQGSDIAWNFGDGGTSKESKASHTFTHPGVYVVLLEASADEYIAKDHILVEVVAPPFTISRVATTSPQYIEIENNSNYEIDLGGWILQNNGVYGRNFPIPKNTFILPHRKIIFPSELTGLETKTDIVSLLFPNAKVLTEYKKVVEIIVATSSIDIVKNNIKNEVIETEVDQSVLSSLSNKINNVLSNNILKSVFGSNDNIKEKHLAIISSDVVEQSQTPTIFGSPATGTVEAAIEADNNAVAAVAATGLDLSKYKNYIWILVLVFAVFCIVAIIRFTDKLERKELGISDQADEYKIIE